MNANDIARSPKPSRCYSFGFGLNGSLYNFISFIGWVTRWLGYVVAWLRRGWDAHWFGYALVWLCVGLVTRWFGYALVWLCVGLVTRWFGYALVWLRRGWDASWLSYDVLGYTSSNKENGLGWCFTNLTHFLCSFFWRFGNNFVFIFSEVFGLY